MGSALLLFAIVFAINVVPAFAPPTWMLLSYFGLHSPDASPWMIAGTAAVAATSGRALLAQLAQRIVHSRLVSPAMRESLSEVADSISRRRAASAFGFLLFAFSPLPSNVLFMAYGLTRAPLWLLAGPFLAGRFVSYAVAFAGAATLARRLDIEPGFSGSLLYFVATQLALLALLYGFAKTDWRTLRRDRRVRLLP